MTDAEQTGESQAATEQIPNSQEAPGSQTTSTTSPSAEDQGVNWKEARHTMKEQRDEIRMLRDEVAQMKPSPPKEEPDDFDSLGNDDIITKGQMMKFGSKIHEKAKKEAFNEFYNKTAEERLENKHNDFRSVCSPENIEKLKERFPDLARSIATNPDAFSQGKAAYDLIVSLGIQNNDAQQNRDKMQANQQKPQLTSGSKPGPLDSAHMFESGQRPSLTKNLKDNLWQEMQAAAKNA